MDAFNFSDDAVKNVADGIERKTTEFEEKIKKIEAISQNVNQSWAGADAKKYTDAIAEQATELKKLADTLEESSTTLKNDISLVQSARQSNIDGINLN